MLVPEDEIPALVEESLLLPAIDLSLDAAAQESTAVAILVPVPRQSLARQAARLRQRLQRATTVPALRLGAKRLPLDTIRLLANTRLSLALPTPLPTVDPVDAVWAELLSAQSVLWYTRRRNLSLRPEIDGTLVAVIDAEDDPTDTPRSRGRATVPPKLTKLLDKCSVYAAAELSRLLGSPKLRASPLLTEAVIARLDDLRHIGSADVAALAEQIGAPGVGEGLARLVEARPELREDNTVTTRLAGQARLLELDRVLANANSFELDRLVAGIKLSGRGALNLDRVLD